MSVNAEGLPIEGIDRIKITLNPSLAVIRDALKNLEEEEIFIDRDLWRPANNKTTIEALSKGDSIGVFYI
jgi:DNA polymerase III alpha subunit